MYPPQYLQEIWWTSRTARARNRGWSTAVLSSLSAVFAGCPAQPISERKGVVLFGFVGILLIVLAVLGVIYGVWMDLFDRGDDCSKTTLTLCVLAVAFAHACLLQLPRLAPRYRWTQIVSTVLIGILALQIIAFIWQRNPPDQVYIRNTGVIAVLVSLMTLVIPICSRLSGKAEAGTEDNSQIAAEGHIPVELVLREGFGHRIFRPRWA